MQWRRAWFRYNNKVYAIDAKAEQEITDGLVSVFEKKSFVWRIDLVSRLWYTVRLLQRIAYLGKYYVT